MKIMEDVHLTDFERLYFHRYGSIWATFGLLKKFSPFHLCNLVIFIASFIVVREAILRKIKDFFVNY